MACIGRAVDFRASGEDGGVFSSATDWAIRHHGVRIPHRFSVATPPLAAVCERYG
jgi:hypothetical protein